MEEFYKEISVSKAFLNDMIQSIIGNEIDYKVDLVNLKERAPVKSASAIVYVPTENKYVSFMKKVL